MNRKHLYPYKKASAPEEPSIPNPVTILADGIETFEVDQQLELPDLTFNPVADYDVVKQVESEYTAYYESGSWIFDAEEFFMETGFTYTYAGADPKVKVTISW